MKLVDPSSPLMKEVIVLTTFSDENICDTVYSIRSPCIVGQALNLPQTPRICGEICVTDKPRTSIGFSPDLKCHHTASKFQRIPWN